MFPPLFTITINLAPPPKKEHLVSFEKSIFLSFFLFLREITLSGLDLGKPFIYLFLFCLFINFIFGYAGLHCCMQAFSSCGERELLSSPVFGLLIAVTSLTVGTGSRHMGLSNYSSRAPECWLTHCGTWAQLLHSMWNLPRPRIEPVSLALADRFLSTEPPGKSKTFLVV